jgi:chaperonin GroES
MTQTLNMLADRIAIRPVPADDRYGSLIIPDTAKRKGTEGEVIAVGPGRLDDDGKRVPLNLKVGDRVMYGRFAGAEVKFEGEELILIKESEILARLERRLEPVPVPEGQRAGKAQGTS